MEKLDLKKVHPSLYKASAKKCDMVTVPPLTYLMCDGHGDPNNSQLFEDAISALYSVAYTLKFMCKKRELQIDYGVMPLEALWWTDDMMHFMDDRSAWKWTAMILQPDFITPAMLVVARGEVSKKKNLPQLGNVRLERMEEGLCGQVLYVGPYKDEGPTIKKLHEFIAGNGCKLSGKHREIYLNDMRRTAPEKLKTIIRQPMIKA